MTPHILNQTQDNQRDAFWITRFFYAKEWTKVDRAAFAKLNPRDAEHTAFERESRAPFAI